LRGEHRLLAQTVATAVLLPILIVLAVAFLAGGPPVCRRTRALRTSSGGRSRRS
jgi:hypothetical protein